MVERRKGVLQQVGELGHGPVEVLLSDSLVDELVGDLDVVQSSLVFLVDRVFGRELKTLGKGHTCRLQVTHSDIALGHTIVGLGKLLVLLDGALAVLHGEVRLFELKVGHGTVGVVSLLRGAEVYRLGVAVDSLLDVAKLKLVVALVFVFFSL